MDDDQEQKSPSQAALDFLTNYNDQNVTNAIKAIIEEFNAQFKTLKETETLLEKANGHLHAAQAQAQAAQNVPAQVPPRDAITAASEKSVRAKIATITIGEPHWSNAI